jgi:hypothetical protein
MKQRIYIVWKFPLNNILETYKFTYERQTTSKENQYISTKSEEGKKLIQFLKLLCIEHMNYTRMKIDKKYKTIINENIKKMNESVHLYDINNENCNGVFMYQTFKRTEPNYDYLDVSIMIGDNVTFSYCIGISLLIECYNIFLVLCSRFGYNKKNRIVQNSHYFSDLSKMLLDIKFVEDHEIKVLDDVEDDAYFE